MNRNNYSPRTIRGHSLIECCIVLMLLACIIGIAITQSSFLHSLHVQSEARALCAMARYLQQRALSTNTVQTLSFDLEQHTYTGNGQCHRFPISIRFDWIPGAAGPPSAPHSPITTACSFANNFIHFWPDGMMTAGTVYLSDTKKTCGYALSSGIGSVSCLRLYHYNRGTWSLYHD